MTNLTDITKPTFFESLLAMFGLMPLSQHERITQNYLNTAKDFRYEHSLAVLDAKRLRSELEMTRAKLAFSEQKLRFIGNGSSQKNDSGGLKSVEAL